MKSLEIEIKFYVLDLERVAKLLQKKGAKLVQARQYENNLRFDLPNQSLEKDHKALRLRYDTKASLTYKGPSRVENGVLSRPEFEVIVDDVDTTIRLLEALGYQITVRYEKHRTTYEFQKCHVMLDELPIGNFIEIEGQDAGKLSSLAGTLGLNSQRAIPMSYLELFNQTCLQHGFDRTRLTFDALADKEIKPEHLNVIPADLD
jgi:adenylate cyclase class 2